MFLHPWSKKQWSHGKNITVHRVLYHFVPLLEIWNKHVTFCTNSHIPLYPWNKENSNNSRISLYKLIPFRAMVCNPIFSMWYFILLRWHNGTNIMLNKGKRKMNVFEHSLMNNDYTKHTNAQLNTRINGLWVMCIRTLSHYSWAELNLNHKISLSQFVCDVGCSWIQVLLYKI